MTTSSLLHDMGVVEESTEEASNDLMFNGLGRRCDSSQRLREVFSEVVCRRSKHGTSEPIPRYLVASYPEKGTSVAESLVGKLSYSWSCIV